MNETPRVERRNGARFALKVPVSVRLPGFPRTPARLLDVSVSGCRLMTPEPWEAGRPFWISIASLKPRFCNVIWSHQRFAGAQFALPIADEDFQKLVADHGRLTEHDMAELEMLSKHCTDLARAAQGMAHARELASLADDCRAQASEYADRVRGERLEAIGQRTKQLLDRLSVPPGE